MPKHIKVVDLPEDETFQQRASSRKNLVDTVKMVAYRAETAMASTIVKECGTLEQGRALIRDVFTSEADLIPDTEAELLTVRLHNLSTRALDSKLDALLKVLNEARIKFPGTKLTLQYQRIRGAADSLLGDQATSGSHSSESQDSVINASS